MEILRTAEANARHGRGTVQRRLAAGLWQRPMRGVVVTHNGPLTPLQHELVLLASVQSGAALGGLTALTHDGFSRFRSDRPQLVLPAGARDPDLDPEAVEVHWSHFLDERDVHPRRQPRRTRVARSLVDAASWSDGDRLARAIVIVGVQQRLTTTRHLREALTRRGTCRRRALIVESVLDAAGGIQSLPERDAAVAFAEAGLRVTRQRPVRGRHGRYYLDIESGGFSVEIHGMAHQAVEQWDKDLVRANEIAILGRRQLAFSAYVVRHERPLMVDQLRRMARLVAAEGRRILHSA
ncbi:MAG: hypothetical protein PGN07_04220 [Aeromicrobium erythreum]